MEIKRELDDWIAGWLEYMKETEAPNIYNKWVAISMIAAALERKVMLRWDKDLYPNFYIVLVGPPGCGKGTAMGPGREILSKLGINLVADATTKERLALSFEEAKNDFEALGDDFSLVTQSALTIYSEEFSVFLGFGNKDIMPWLCAWFDCLNDWSYKTKHQGENKFENVWLNIIGATTPELLQDVLPRETFGSGLNSRILYVYADRCESPLVLFPFAVSGRTEIKEKLLRDLQEINLIRGEFKPDEGYLEKWAEWYPEQRGIEFAGDQRFSGYVNRRATHVHKLAMIMNVSRNGKLDLSKEDLERAIKTLGEMEQRMPKTFEGFGRSATAAIQNAILVFIRKRGGVKYSEILNAYKNEVDNWSLSNIIATLEKAKVIKLSKLVEEKDYLISDAKKKLTP